MVISLLVIKIPYHLSLLQKKKIKIYQNDEAIYLLYLYLASQDSYLPFQTWFMTNCHYSCKATTSFGN